MINGLAKIYETTLNRIITHFNTTHGIVDMQFGFRRGLSTIDAIEKLKNIVAEEHTKGQICVVATIDIKDAFNRAGWNEI